MGRQEIVSASCFYYTVKYKIIHCDYSFLKVGKEKLESYMQILPAILHRWHIRFVLQPESDAAHLGILHFTEVSEKIKLCCDELFVTDCNCNFWPFYLVIQ